MRPTRREWSIALCIALLVNLVAGPPARATQSPIPLDEYWHQIEQALELVTSLQSESPGAATRALRAEADHWEHITQVRLPDGTLMPVDHSFLVAQLRAEPPNLAQLENLLGAMLAARDRWPQAKLQGSDLEVLERILARPEFQWRPEQPSPLARLWQRLLQWLWELVGRLMPAGATAPLPAHLLGYALTGLGGVLLLLVLAYALRGLLANLVPESGIGPEDGAGDEELTAATAFKRAQRLSGDGDYRAAVRYLYLSSLLLLEERGLLRYDRSLTNREYVRSVSHLPQLASALRDVVEVFDRVWYGFQRLDEAAYERYAAHVADLQRKT